MNDRIWREEKMNSTPEPRRALVTMGLTVFAIASLMIAFGVAKKTGLLDPQIARRGAGALLGLMLVATGNFVPKLRLFQPEGDAVHSGLIDRFAGWAFVMSGTIFTAIWLLAPVSWAMLASPLIGAAGLLIVLTRWLIWKGPRRDGFLPSLTPGRITLAILLSAVFWTFAIFFADAVWGDQVSQGMAMSFSIVLVALVPFLVIGLKRMSDH